MMQPPVQNSDPIEVDYASERQQAFLQAIIGRLHLQPRELLPLNDVRERLVVRGQHDRGIQLVPLANIVRSQGRYLDFGRSFLPLRGVTAQRWKQVRRAHYHSVELPPVDLYKLSDVYFVADGNHRVSVARHTGQVEIRARVTELDIDVPLSPQLKATDLNGMEEQADFFAWTDLAQLRPGSRIEVSELGGYLELIRHINWQRTCLSALRGTPVTSAEAAADWYDTVYAPLVDAIRASNVLRAFPKRTETDLYLWIMEHGQELLEATPELHHKHHWFYWPIQRTKRVGCGCTRASFVAQANRVTTAGIACPYRGSASCCNCSWFA